MKAFLRCWYYRAIYKGVKFEKDVTIAGGFQYGSGVYLCKGSFVYNSSIAGYSYLGSNSILQNVGVGRFCSIGPEVRVGLGRHPSSFVSTYPGTYLSQAGAAVKLGGNCQFEEYLPIKIGNDVYIGARAMVLDGVNISDGAIIAAGAIVTKDVPPYAIVGGVPAKILKYRFDHDTISRLLEMKWWNWEESVVRERLKTFGNVGKFLEEFGEE